MTSFVVLIILGMATTFLAILQAPRTLWLLCENDFFIKDLRANFLAFFQDFRTHRAQTAGLEHRAQTAGLDVTWYDDCAFGVTTVFLPVLQGLLVTEVFEFRPHQDNTLYKALVFILGVSLPFCIVRAIILFARDYYGIPLRQKMNIWERVCLLFSLDTAVTGLLMVNLGLQRPTTTATIFRHVLFGYLAVGNLARLCAAGRFLYKTWQGVITSRAARVKRSAATISGESNDDQPSVATTPPRRRMASSLQTAQVLTRKKRTAYYEAARTGARNSKDTVKETYTTGERFVKDQNSVMNAVAQQHHAAQEELQEEDARQRLFSTGRPCDPPAAGYVPVATLPTAPSRKSEGKLRNQRSPSDFAWRFEDLGSRHDQPSKRNDPTAQAENQAKQQYHEMALQKGTENEEADPQHLPKAALAGVPRTSDCDEQEIVGDSKERVTKNDEYLDHMRKMLSDQDKHHKAVILQKDTEIRELEKRNDAAEREMEAYQKVMEPLRLEFNIVQDANEKLESRVESHIAAIQSLKGVIDRDTLERAHYQNLHRELQAKFDLVHTQVEEQLQEVNKWRSQWPATYNVIEKLQAQCEELEHQKADAMNIIREKSEHLIQAGKELGLELERVSELEAEVEHQRVRHLAQVSDLRAEAQEEKESHLAEIRVLEDEGQEDKEIFSSHIDKLRAEAQADREGMLARAREVIEHLHGERREAETRLQELQHQAQEEKNSFIARIGELEYQVDKERYDSWIHDIELEGQAQKERDNLLARISGLEDQLDEERCESWTQSSDLTMRAQRLAEEITTLQIRNLELEMQKKDLEAQVEGYTQVDQNDNDMTEWKTPLADEEWSETTLEADERAFEETIRNQNQNRSESWKMTNDGADALKQAEQAWDDMGEKEQHNDHEDTMTSSQTVETGSTISDSYTNIDSDDCSLVDLSDTESWTEGDDHLFEEPLVSSAAQSQDDGCYPSEVEDEDPETGYQPDDESGPDAWEPTHNVAPRSNRYCFQAPPAQPSPLQQSSPFGEAFEAFEFQPWYDPNNHPKPTHTTQMPSVQQDDCRSQAEAYTNTGRGGGESLIRKLSRGASNSLRRRASTTQSLRLSLRSAGARTS